MANLQAGVRVLAAAGSAPSGICGSLNALIAGNLTPEKFITFFIGRIDPDRRRLVYANAGHNPPLLFRGGMLEQRLDRRGPVLGVVDGAAYTDGVVDLEPGDRLVLYTDGLSEASDRAGVEFSESRIIETVLRDPAATAEVIRGRLIEEVERFSEGRFADDVTLIVVVVTGT